MSRCITDVDDYIRLKVLQTQQKLAEIDDQLLARTLPLLGDACSGIRDAALDSLRESLRRADENMSLEVAHIMQADKKR